MSWLASIPVIGSLIDKLSGKVAADKGTIVEGQNAINQAEVSGAPVSRLRLWRGFLGWVLAICFVWEAVARPIIETYWPHVMLPPSTIEITSRILLGMLGLGF